MRVSPPYLSLISLTLLTAAWGSQAAMAQLTTAAPVVNDPADSMRLNSPNYFKPADPKADPTLDDNQKKLAKSKENSKSQKQTSPNVSGLQPMLDLQDTSTNENSSEAKTSVAAKAPATDSLKGRAVTVDINSNTLNYDKDRDVYVATGAVHMIISEQNSELYSDKLTYDQNQNLAIAEGHVVIIKNGQKTEGEYAKIDLTRHSALINDSVTTVSSVRVKAKQSFMNQNEIVMENGRFIISGALYAQLDREGGIGNIATNTGKGSQLNGLQRDYSEQVFKHQAQLYKTNNTVFNNDIAANQQELYSSVFKYDPTKETFNDEDPSQISRFGIKAKEIDVVRYNDGYNDIMLRKPSLYMGKWKLFNLIDTDMSDNGKYKEVEYLGPDIGADRDLGGNYAGPGWDFHLGQGSLRFSPIISYGSPGYVSNDGKTGKNIANGLGVGTEIHFRDPWTTADLGYDTHVGYPTFFLDRQLFTAQTHFMAAYHDNYGNGLLGQNEHPTYIGQISDYRVVKDFSNFQLTSFESLGYAKDNFYPNYTQTYFVESKGGASPQTLGRGQLQFQLANVQPLYRYRNLSFGARAQLITAGYTSGNFLALGRVGPTMNISLFKSHLQSSLSYMLSDQIGKSPFVFDTYFGGVQNLGANNLVVINKYLSIGSNSSFSLNRDNAQKALLVGNAFFMMVGPPDLKATIGYDFIANRSYFGFNYFPGAKTTLVNFDKMKILQPTNYNQPNAASTF